MLRVTLRRHDLATEVFHLKEPVKVPLVMSRNEVKRVLAIASGLKARVMLSLAYGCGMRAGEVVRLKVGDIDGEQKIIRIVEAKPPCLSHGWRLRMSSAPMALPGGRPMRAMSASIS